MDDAEQSRGSDCDHGMHMMERHRDEAGNERVWCKACRAYIQYATLNPPPAMTLEEIKAARKETRRLMRW